MTHICQASVLDSLYNFFCLSVTSIVIVLEEMNQIRQCLFCLCTLALKLMLIHNHIQI